MASSSGIVSDRIGIQIANLALQKGLITQEQWSQALAELKRERALRSTPRSIAQIFIDKGILSKEQVGQLRRLASSPPSPPKATKLSSRLPKSGKSGPGEPTPFGKYLLLSELGRGGRGVVYEATDTKSGRKVALKLLRNNPEASPEEREREREWFLREAQLGARVPSHPGLVRINDTGVTEGRRYIELDLVRGVRFDRWCTLNAEMTRRITVLRDVAHAVHHAHEHGVIHRDLKPQNILVDSIGRARVTDFGTARLVRSDSKGSLTAWGQAIGTAAYMSPEQAQASPDVDRKTDVYSLGVMLYELLCGQRPFEGDTAFDTIMKAMTKEAEPPSKIAEQTGGDPVNRALEAVCQRAMAREPEKRTATALDFAKALDQWLAGMRSSMIIPRVSRPWRWAVAGGVLLALAAAALIVFKPAPESPAPAAAPAPPPVPELPAAVRFTPGTSDGLRLPDRLAGKLRIDSRLTKKGFHLFPSEHGLGLLPLDIDDAWATAATVVELEIEYFDAPMESFWFDFKYDSTEERLLDEGAARASTTLWLEGSSSWKTAKIVLPDPRFENRMPEACDLQLIAMSPELLVGSITVRRLPEAEAAPLYPKTLRASAPDGTLEPGLKAHVFSGKSFDRPVARRIDPWVAFRWGSGPGPSGLKDDFSVRWSGWILVPETGTYLLALQSDDGVRLRIDGVSLVENWSNHSERFDLVRCTLEKGYHRFVLDYYEDRHRATCLFSLLREQNGRNRDVSAGAFFHER